MIDCKPGDCAFVTNATDGVNAVLSSLRFESGDEILYTNHGYNACNNAVRYYAERSGAVAVQVELPFPVQDPNQITEAVVGAVTSRTKLAVIDHIGSPSAFVLPIHQIVQALESRGIQTLVDGAHAPGQVEVSLRSIRPSYYAGNLHKWMCTPKTAAFLYVRPELQDQIVPSVVSHGYNIRRPNSTRFHDLFDWPGTTDPTPVLCLPKVLSFLNGLLDGGLPALLERNRQLAVDAKALLLRTLDTAPVCPASMSASMFDISLPPGLTTDEPLDLGTTPTPKDALQSKLLAEFGIEVPVFHISQTRVIRISVHAYNQLADVQRLAAALITLMEQPTATGDQPT